MSEMYFEELKKRKVISVCSLYIIVIILQSIDPYNIYSRFLIGSREQAFDSEGIVRVNFFLVEVDREMRVCDVIRELVILR